MFRARIMRKDCITISYASVSRYCDIVGCSQAGDGPSQRRDKMTRILALMTAAVGVGQFQPETL